MIAELLPLMVSLLAQSVIDRPLPSPEPQAEIVTAVGLSTAQVMQQAGLTLPVASPTSE